MMRPLHVYTAEGIVLKRRVVGEADRIITVFTRQHGKLRLIAKGVRRITSRRAGHLEVFSHVILSIHTHKGLDIVTEAERVSEALIEGDSAGLGYAYCMCELVDQLLADGQEHEDVFFLLKNSLRIVGASKDAEVWQAVMSRYVHELLRNLGFLSVSRKLSTDEIKDYIENITERKLHSWPLLAELTRAS